MLGALAAALLVSFGLEDFDRIPTWIRPETNRP